MNTDRKENVCYVCSETFANQLELKIHRCVRHGEKKFKCDFCDHSFDRNCNLKGHVEAKHLLIKHHVCVECGEKFSRKIHLTEHSFIHTGEKPYKCVECGATFRTASQVYNHRLVVHGGTPFKCEKCGCGFKKKESLLAHCSNHTGVKPFKCADCGEGFAYKYTLSRHQKKKHVSVGTHTSEMATNSGMLSTDEPCSATSLDEVLPKIKVEIEDPEFQNSPSPSTNC